MQKDTILANRGLCYQLLGNYHMAINDYNVVLNSNPANYLTILSRRGECYLRGNDRANGIKDLNEVIRLADPS